MNIKKITAFAAASVLSLGVLAAVPPEVCDNYSGNVISASAVKNKTEKDKKSTDSKNDKKSTEKISIDNDLELIVIRDSENRVIREEFYSGSGKTLRSIDVTYGKGKKPEKITLYDEEGDVYFYAVYKYDKDENLISKKSYWADGSLCGRITQTYNSDGLLVCKKTEGVDKYNNGNCNGDGEIIVYKDTGTYKLGSISTYDITYNSDNTISYVHSDDGSTLSLFSGKENFTYTSDGEGSHAVYEYNEKNQISEAYYYHFHGENCPDKNLKAMYNHVYFSYDEKGRITERTDYTESCNPGKKEVLIQKDVYVYDELDNVILQECNNYNYNGRTGSKTTSFISDRYIV